MKFAANGPLYRGSKPVMWSVVEKTALAEAEVEYEDYTSDTVFVAFPVPGRGPDAARCSTTARVELECAELQALDGATGARLGRDLDDDALDDAGQPRHRLLVARRLRPLRGDRGRGRTTGPRPARATSLADSLAAGVFKAARVEGFERVAGRRRPRHSRSASAPTRFGERWAALRLPGAAARRRPRHRREPAPGSSIPRRATAARTSTSGWHRPAASPSAASTRASPTRSMPTAPSRPTRRASRAAACSTDKGEQGRRQRGGDHGAGRGRHAGRARAS